MIIANNRPKWCAFLLCTTLHLLASFLSTRKRNLLQLSGLPQIKSCMKCLKTKLQTTNLCTNIYCIQQIAYINIDFQELLLQFFCKFNILQDDVILGDCFLQNSCKFSIRLQPHCKSMVKDNDQSINSSSASLFQCWQAWFYPYK